MKWIVSLLAALILSIPAALACSCHTPAFLEEGFGADYVFEAEAISKVYEPDRQYYQLTFNVLRHYKAGPELPDSFTYRLPAEPKDSGEYSSCDWYVETGERWLIFSHNRQGQQ